MLWIDPDGLRTNGAEFRDLGDQAQRTFEQLRAALAQEGRCWGDDEPGKAFEQNYLPDAERGLDALQQLATALQDFGQQLNAAADSFETQDQFGAQQIDNAANPLVDDTHTNRPQEVRPTNPQLSIGDTPPLFPPRIVEATPGQNVSNGRTVSGDSSTEPAAGRRAPESPQEPGKQSRINSGSAPSTIPRVAGPVAAPWADPAAATKLGTPTDRNAAAPNRVIAHDVVPSRTAARLTYPSRTTATTPWQSGPRPVVGATPNHAPPNTPWSNTTSGSASSQWGRTAARAGESARNKNEDRRRAVTAPRTTPWLTRPGNRAHPLVEGLADRHGLTVAGFDNPELDEALIREFAAAVDKVLTSYPVLAVSHVVMERLPLGEMVRVRRHRPTGLPRPLTWSIALNSDLASEPARLDHMLRQALSSGSTVPGSTERPVYALTLHEIGTALDISGHCLARRAAQRGLIAEYLGGNNDYGDANLGSVVRGYKRWRDQLCGRSFTNGCFDPSKALAWAFTDVVINGARAAEPAAVLHQLLVDTAQTIATIQRDANTTNQQTGQRSSS